MPRIPTSLLRKAFVIDPLLPRLLPPCRDLHAAQNELRWLREHAEDVLRTRSRKGDHASKTAILRHLVDQRASGRPLQYILGNEYFGDLEIRCRPGVLIPRQDTATSVKRLVRLLCGAEGLPPELCVLDLCTGTGAIPLLFHHDFYAARDDIDLLTAGVDISNRALNLSMHNRKRLRRMEALSGNGHIRFLKGDVLAQDDAEISRHVPFPLKAALRLCHYPTYWDILISNPPYISPSEYWRTTARSVRLYEPKLALVPPSQVSRADMDMGDAFYVPILNTARRVQAKIVLLEVADLDQALRVAREARAMHIFDGIEIWREQPDALTDSPAASTDFREIGQGNARSVFCWRGAGTRWLGLKAPSPTFRMQL